MNTYTKEFFHRGLMFGGFGPIVMGIIFFIMSLTAADFAPTGAEIFTAIVSTYLLAFVQAGASVFNQIEHWSLGKSLLVHFTTLYIAYSLCYIANTWIPFEPMVLAIFTAVFAATYFAIWFTVYLIVRNTTKRLNRKLK